MSDQTTPDWLSLARDAYTASNTYFDASIRAGIEADLRQFQGQHPANSKYLADRARSRLFRPKTRTTIRKNEAQAAEAFFSTNDVVSVSPEDDNDPGRRASAAVMQELLQYRLTKSIPWFQIAIGAYQDAQTVGVVCSYQYWEYNQVKKRDQPAIRLIPVENLRFDAAANWTDPVNTSPYVIELIPMYVKDVKARMKQADPKTGEAKWKMLDDSQIMQATRNYTDTIRQQREGQGRTDSKQNQQAYNAYNIVWVHKNIIEVDQVDYCYYTLGTEQLLSEPVPLNELYFHGRRPYVVGCAVIETHKVYSSSIPRLTRDVQAEINEIANQRIDNVKLVLNKRYFAKRNKQVDLRSITRNVPGSVTLMQDTDDVKTVEFNDVTASSYKEQEVLNLDFDDVAGAFSSSSVQSNRKLNETVGGMKMLDANATQVSGYQLRTFVETWVEPVLRQLVLLEQYYETDEFLIALCGQQAKIAQKFGIDSITDDMLMREVTLNVNVGIGATNPAEQVAQFIQAMTALRDILSDNQLINYGLNINEVIKELFGKLGYKDGGRFFDTDKQDPQLTQLQNTVKQLQQALDAKIDPKLLDAQIRKIDAEIASLGVKDKQTGAQAVKTLVEAEFSAMQGAEVIAAVPQVAPVADAMMIAAGYQAPNPAGVDPNFPQPAGPANGLMVQDVTNKRSGIGFMPGDGSSTLNPMKPPEPVTPGIGVRQGIETQRPDSIQQAAFANGGLLSPGVNLDGTVDEEDMVLQQVRPTPVAQTPTLGQFKNEAGQVDNINNYVGYLSDRNLAPNATNNSQINGQMMKQGTVHSLLKGSMFNNYADGGLIDGPGTGTSDSIAASVEGMPVAVSDGEFVVPKQVVQTLGQDFFEALITRLHTPAPEGQPNPLPTANPLRLQDGSFIVPADVTAALGQDFFETLVAQYGAQA